MEQITNGESGASVRAKLNELIGASVLPSRMEIIDLSGIGILFPLFDKSQTDKSFVTGIDVSYSYLLELPNLDEYINLQELNCGFNQLTSLPSLPTNLLWLGCHSNQLTGLSNLAALVSLQELHAWDNQLTSLPTLPVSLQLVHFADNQLTATAISQALIDLDANDLSEGVIYLNGGTNAIKSDLTEAGLIAYDNLIIKDWAISMNE